MRRSRLLLLVAALLGLVGLGPAQAVATTPNDEAATYKYELEVPNSSQAPNGDKVTVTGMGTFSVHPKTATGGGQFTHTLASGGTVSGTWTALDTLAFQPYGCGMVLGNPIPPNLCGGMLKLDVMLTPTSPSGLAPHEGMLTIICIIGKTPGPPFVGRNATEGILLDVPGVANFNMQLPGSMNVFIRTG